MRKKIKFTIFIYYLLLTILVSNVCFASPISYGNNTQDKKIENKENVLSTIYNLEKYDSKRDINRLKKCFSKNFISPDGFDYDTYFNIIKKTWALYPKYKYSTIIKNINVANDSASVTCIEKLNGISTKKTCLDEKKDNFLLNSQSEIIYYLKKESNGWVITTFDVLKETTILKYGRAKDIEMELLAPLKTIANLDYTVTLNVKKPKNTIILASLTNEPIIFPAVDSEEIFRSISESGTLERIVKANNKGYNENVIASISVSDKLLNAQIKGLAQINGLAFIITRVNVIHGNKK